LPDCVLSYEMSNDVQPEVGTQAIIQTARFRCRAVMGEGGCWVDPHDPGRVYQDVKGYEPAPSIPLEPDLGWQEAMEEDRFRCLINFFSVKGD
jgi:hypothetical protein